MVLLFPRQSAFETIDLVALGTARINCVEYQVTRNKDSLVRNITGVDATSDIKTVVQRAAMELMVIISPRPLLSQDEWSGVVHSIPIADLGSLPAPPHHPYKMSNVLTLEVGPTGSVLHPARSFRSPPEAALSTQMAGVSREWLFLQAAHSAAVAQREAAEMGVV